MTTHAEQLAELDAALKAGPTPGMLMAEGPSEPTPSAPEGGDWCVMDGGTNVVAEFFYRVNYGPGGTRAAEANARLYAACTPEFLRTLLEEREALLKLAKFGAWCTEEFRRELADVDGGSAQDAMERFGVIVKVEVTEPCGEGCVCAEVTDFPTECYSIAPDVKETMAALQKTGS